MPNHITNELRVTGSEEQKVSFFEKVKFEEYGRGSLDFNKVIPMPGHIYQGNLGQREIKLYGKNNWYDWRIEHWGSKWNSYGYTPYTSQDFDGKTLRFLTAWRDVRPVIEALARQHPELCFHYRLADEDFGFNVGEIEYANGEEVCENIPQGGSPEACELAKAILGF